MKIEINGSKEQHQESLQRMFTPRECMVIVAALINFDKKRIHINKREEAIESKEIQVRKIAEESIESALGKFMCGMPPDIAEGMKKILADSMNYHIDLKEYDDEKVKDMH